MPLSSIIKKNCSVCNKTAIEKSRFQLGSTSVITLECGHVLTADKLAVTDYSSIVSSDGRRLMPFQIEGIKFAEQANARVLIADEQGLGKTVSCNALVSLHLEELTPAVCVVKRTLKAQWMHEFFRWTSTRKVQVIESSKERPIPGFDVYIITYDILKTDGMFDSVNIKTVIIDECQAIKNHLSERAKAVQKLCKTAEHVIALSGTPIKNNAGEYFTILNILQPSRFPEYQRYINTYCDAYWSGYGNKVGGLSRPELFHEKTKDFIIRRTQREVLPDLYALKQPRKFQHVELDSKLNKAYASALQELDDLYYSDEGLGDGTSMMAIMTKLRQITGISKAIECIDYVSDFLLSTDRKIIIFAHHHTVVDLLESKINEWLKDGGYNNCVMIRAGADTKSKIEEFKNPNTRVLIASTLASGEGLDGLQFLCSDMILLERQWNPANEEQVEGRIGRIGQTNPCNFIYMIASGTIDDLFTDLVEQKRAYVASALDGQVVQWEQSSLVRELAEMLVTKGREKWRL